MSCLLTSCILAETLTEKYWIPHRKPGLYRIAREGTASQDREGTASKLRGHGIARQHDII